MHFWLDQRNVGVQMKVERSSVDSVKDRLAMLKRKKEEPEEEYGKLWYPMIGWVGLCI